MKSLHDQPALCEVARDEDSRLDALLAKASRPQPPPGFCDRVLAALHEEARRDAAWAELVSSPRPYARLKHWSAGIAACAALALSVLGLVDHLSAPAPSLQEQAVGIAEEVLLQEALGTISDAELLSAIYSVSSGTYSVSASIEGSAF